MNIFRELFIYSKMNTHPELDVHASETSGEGGTWAWGMNQW